ncbi:hypothetical protein [Paraburkholderia phenoliruptrix]|nr:hypothetical protein [Paraburkholderia phenoliruptrix]
MPLKLATFVEESRFDFLMRAQQSRKAQIRRPYADSYQIHYRIC